MANSATGIAGSDAAWFALTRIEPLAWLTAALIALRFVTAAYLPLSFDEAYFWLWSKHLAISYYDHPPLIALTIRAGTFLFGDSEFGVRAVSLFSSIAASWAVWRAAALLTCTERAGVWACALFNATLMATSQFIAATPDALVMTAAAFLLLSLARLRQADDGRWWLLAAGALGTAFLSKYTAFFLAAGTGLWCAATPPGRRWLRTPWPYGAAIFAAICFAPALLWNAGHDWISFRFQFGRVTSGGASGRYLLEFALAQLALASPVILTAALIGLYKATRHWREAPPPMAAAALVWPGLVYFALHALHSRVQGNWPSFIYPALAVLAAAETSPTRGMQSQATRTLKALALPAALLILTGAYLQTWTGAIPAGKQDPVARMMGIGMPLAARELGDIAVQSHAAAILTGKYVVASWLSFYLPQPIPIVQIADEQRWLETSQASLRLLQRPLLFVTQEPGRELAAVHSHFSRVAFERSVARKRAGVTLDKFYVYALSGFRGQQIGRVVHGDLP